MNKGTIRFKDSQKNFSAMRIEDTVGTKVKTDVATLKTALSAKSDCDVRGEAYIDETLYSVAGAGALQDKAIITAQDTDGHVHKWALPGYNGTPVQDDDGWVMVDADRDALVTAIATFTGLTLSALRSPYIVTR